MFKTNEEESVLQSARDWLAARHREGNWYDIAPTDEIPSCVVPEFRTILQMFQLRFGPEIRKRLDEGRIDSFVLHMAQFVQREDRPPEIRLNDEIRGNAQVRANRDVSKGDTVNVRDLDGAEGFDLHPDERDAGHFTLFRTTNGDWRGFFDFRMWRSEAGKLLDAAAEFHAAAEFSCKNGRKRASVDNLFTACELISKAHLMLHHHPGIRASKKHTATHSAINRWSHIGNVDKNFTELFNRLSKGRNAAKYDADADIMPPSHDDVVLVEAELDALARSIAARF